MKCPHCGGEISPAAILGKEGGKKSKRTINAIQQAKMQAAKISKQEAARRLSFPRGEE